MSVFRNGPFPLSEPSLFPGTQTGEIRLGHNIPLDFGSDIIHTGAAISAPVIQNSSPGWKNFGSHIFLSSQVEAVGRDIFLDGNTFESSPSVDKNSLVADLSAGYALSFDTIKIPYGIFSEPNSLMARKRVRSSGHSP